MYRFWLLFLAFVPLVPTNLKLTRTDPVKNHWVFTCTWKDPVMVARDAWRVARVFYTETLAAHHLAEKSD